MSPLRNDKLEKRSTASLSDKVSATSDVESTDPVVLELHPEDVLLGRGAQMFSYPGNLRFRDLVTAKKLEYSSSSRHHVKQKIARDIVDEIGRRNGRFLRKLDLPLDHNGLPTETAVWDCAGYCG